MLATTGKIRYSFKAECGCQSNLMESHAPFTHVINSLYCNTLELEFGSLFSDEALEFMSLNSEPPTEWHNDE